MVFKISNDSIMICRYPSDTAPWDLAMDRGNPADLTAFVLADRASFLCEGTSLLMGWSGRAPAPPASEAGKGRQRRGARHVSDSQYRNRRDRHRYRQELVPRRGPRCARRHRAAAKVVAWPSGSAARQYTALPDRHGSLRRRTSPEPQTRIAWSRCQVDAGQICPPL